MKLYLHVMRFYSYNCNKDISFNFGWQRRKGAKKSMIFVLRNIYVKQKAKMQGTQSELKW